MDIRLGFILVLLVTIVCGVELWSWNVNYWELAKIVGGAIMMQLIFSWTYHIPANTFKSAIITSLLLVICLRTELYCIYLIVFFLALSSKYVLNIKRRLIFNPTVFGLFMMLLFIGNGHIGFFNTPTYAEILFVLASILLQWRGGLGRYEASVSYLATSVVMAYLWPGMSVSPEDMNWVLFASAVLMLDRSSLPNSPMGRLAFGVIVGLGQFWLFYPEPLPNRFVYSSMIMYLVKSVAEYRDVSHSFFWNGLIVRKLNSN